ncbi:Myotubularin protein 2 [Trichuris trichiura]|uniref:Myotubularin protein 2 n=1 Tax=Trichuris trichiura TaxID=36087 RepID=A0A077YWY8_TRITR|nr:Myotubularin protein 2 [Trichuris trichiura]
MTVNFEVGAGIVLLPGEEIVIQGSKTALSRHVDLISIRSFVLETDIGFLSCAGKIIGRMTVTNYRLLFESSEEVLMTLAFDISFFSVKKCTLDIPLGTINRLDKMGYSNMSRGEDSYGFEIFCKVFFFHARKTVELFCSSFLQDFRTFRFSSRQENHARRPLFECLQKLAFPLSHKLVVFSYTYQVNPFFAFQSKEKFNSNGWLVYDPVKEYNRMVLSNGIPNTNWRISQVNRRYNMANTYPNILCVPTLTSDEDLAKVANFRSRRRLPVCCWLHPNGHASLSRSSQPSVGVISRRNHGDELYLQTIIGTNRKSRKLYIMDARPAMNARANKAKGGGYESEAAYPNAELVFLDIENIHVMRERQVITTCGNSAEFPILRNMQIFAFLNAFSLRKLREICVAYGEDKKFFTHLDETRWLDHLVLCGAARIVDKIYNYSTSVLVHCSDGWDRTSQLTSLAMLMLDPYYRTIKGFEVLIEKEWCSFGHKFAHRVGHGEDKPGDTERSPVFLQFIDCVHQLLHQFPQSFEFNSLFLISIMDHVYSCRFGTFLFNSECERWKVDVHHKTNSVWSFLNSQTEQFTNPTFNQVGGLSVLIPCCSVRRIRFWIEYYRRWNPADNSLHKMNERAKLYRQMVNVRLVLSEKMQELRKKQKNCRSVTSSTLNLEQTEKDGVQTS